MTLIPELVDRNQRMDIPGESPIPMHMWAALVGLNGLLIKKRHEVGRNHVRSMWGSWKEKLVIYMFIFHYINVWDSQELNNFLKSKI